MAPGTTLFGGEALRSTAVTGPAQRCATDRQSATTAGGGPADDTRSKGWRRSAATAGVTSSSTTHPRTRRPCSRTRTIAPTRTSPASASGTR